jgi:DNA-binding NarL/FixJ family response regulator
MPIRVALVEDNPNLLKALRQNLSLYDEIEIVGVAMDGERATQLAEKQRPQVVLMDIEMPIQDGITATDTITRKWPETKVLILTIFDRDDKLFEAIKAGASGYLLKDERPAQIVQAIQEVMDGGAPMSPGIALKTLNLLRQQTIVYDDSTRQLDVVQSPEAFSLTSREVEILEQLVEGLTPIQIGELLFISHYTVRKHIENIYNKLHVHTRLEVIRLAEQNRWFK